ncbi:MAG: bifunctional (p)ppGpp synthetase/guanosine-3',5'-bis(diphosphate) 3'-pyrophosphohydrolase, partial [Parcubacteria group bacterium]|nr:bifunctional (p)ppGpp synthetase/guanosine-3',5'-bis(diphosphate) 3'-pyrophosphohydrolase [Parcubacteria group bacterium]
MASVAELLKIIDEEKLRVDKDLIRLAFDFAQEAHQGKVRKNGEPYLNHSLETAKTLARYHLDQDTIIAGLLHDVPEDTDRTLQDVRKEFGKDVAGLVEGITKLGKLKYRGIERYIENLRKMFVAMASDIRVIFIKFADRLHNLKTLDALESEKQERIARETLEIYAPIANRLGMWQLKGRLEDLSFKYLYPREYQNLKEALDKNFSEREQLLKHLCRAVKVLLTGERMKVLEISGRTKDLWSLHQKLQKHNNEMHHVHDIIALRVVVPTVADCYRALGVIHSRWRPLPNRFKDYIAQPKPNGYQSLHTTIFCDKGKTVEIQIKTREMHQAAEYGIAAHWHYDERGSIKLDKTLDWVQELSKWQQEVADSEQYLDSLKIDVFQDRIFVFTPKGDVIDLPENSTPVDFAYHIHTQIGDRATAARINNQMAALSTPLKSGDMVEIIIEKNRKGPNRDWLKFVKTRAAREKIKANAPKGIWGAI